ncbi:MAG TPA: KpsF/GutQ family sugar-phosphate isomerase [Gemmataceae bacterium]|jgi:arabinose-5-phosphate isomerase|nr:KpsF/GutQ family sugar-phosphate isomerase [Gemmataceae bacterium]
MSLQVHLPPRPILDRLAYAREILRGEAAALELVARRLDDSFPRAIDLLQDSRGRVCLTGTGKSADVGQKIAGTLNSTGTRAYVLDATRAVHGDLGMLHPDDVVLALSHSGESEEIVRLLPSLRTLGRAIVALTSNPRSTLAGAADVVLAYGPLDEVCPLGLAPSTSTTAMIALGDALAFVLSRARDFSKDDFARFHPAGSLGRQLLNVEALMRRSDDMRLAAETVSVREVFAQVRRRGRRTGAVILTGSDGRLTGLFTDSDLARLFEQRRDAALDRPISEVMTANPLTVAVGSRVVDAVEAMKRKKISELPVVDAAGRPAGLLDITDVIGLISREEAERIARVA